MLLQVILEGIGLGVLLILVCAIGIRKGTVGMAVIAAVLAGIMMLFTESRGDINAVSNLWQQESSYGAVLSCYGRDGRKQRTGCELLTG